MEIIDNNIQVFQDTRQKSFTDYQSQTETLVSNTEVYEDPANLPIRDKRIDHQSVSFVEMGTIEAAKQFQSGRTGILSLADAFTPGGLVIAGETTQEGSICRCSNLYESLIKPECIDGYYQFNERNGGFVYTDRLIYSPEVLVFKDDIEYKELQEPFHVDVVTCSPPSIYVNNDIFLHRIQGIINAFKYYDVDTVILGAWGCRAFGQDAYDVGRCFSEVLSSSKYFKNVIFAVRTDWHTQNFTRLYAGYNSRKGA